MSIDSADQPVFKLGIDAGACRFEVRVNDVPILRSDVSRPFDVEFPVSEWIVRGPNRIAALVQPPPVWDEQGDEVRDQEAFDVAESALKLTLWVKRNGAPREQRQALTTLNFVARDVGPQLSGVQSSASGGRLDPQRGFRRDDDAGTVMVSEVTLRRDDEPPHDVFMFRDVGMRSPFPLWAWERGQPLTDDDGTRDSLMAEYKRVWGLLQARDVAGVEQLQATKAAEYAKAYYLDTPAKVRDALPLADLMQSDDLQLQPFDEDLELEIYGEGRLAKLVDEDGDSPIVFVGPGDVGYWMELTYCWLDDAWVLVR